LSWLSINVFDTIYNATSRFPTSSALSRRQSTCRCAALVPLAPHSRLSKLMDSIQWRVQGDITIPYIVGIVPEPINMSCRGVALQIGRVTGRETMASTKRHHDSLHCRHCPGTNQH